jgi:spore coat-associated protein N
VMVFAIVSGATFAYFSDTETSSNNSITAGTLDLVLTDSAENGNDSETNTWTFSNVYPTMADLSGTLTISNVGTLAGYLDLSSLSVTNAEGTNPESETSTGYQLSQLLYVKMFWDENGNGTFDGLDAYIFGNAGTYVAFNTLHAQTVNANKSLAGGGTTHITMKINWPSTANDNDAQGDITTFSFTVELDQVAD